MAHMFVNNLTVMDFSYLDSDRGVVGESWIVGIELIGELDEQGMMFDFSRVKKQIKQFIDAHADHRLLVPTAMPGCHIKRENGTLLIEFPMHSGAVIRHESPIDAVLLIEADTINAAQIATDLQCQLKSMLPENVREVIITLSSENINGAYYHYTHGLQKHAGQCQRIAHGHRSRIEIEVSGERSSLHESQWAARLSDIYIATQDHIVDQFEYNGIPHMQLAYTAQQGDFSLTLPSAQVFQIPNESTVENIANFLASSIAESATQPVAVRAFEGVAKGAVGRA